MSAGDTVSQLETDQFTPLQLSLQPFRLIVNLWCKLDLKERGAINEIKRKLEQEQGGEGAAEVLSRESHATASMFSRCCLAQLQPVRHIASSGHRNLWKFLHGNDF